MKDYETDDELFWDTKIGNRTITPVAVAHLERALRRFPDGDRDPVQPRARLQHDDGT